MYCTRLEWIRANERLFFRFLLLLLFFYFYDTSVTKYDDYAARTMRYPFISKRKRKTKKKKDLESLRFFFFFLSSGFVSLTYLKSNFLS